MRGSGPEALSPDLATTGWGGALGQTKAMTCVAVETKGGTTDPAPQDLDLVMVFGREGRRGVTSSRGNAQPAAEMGSGMA
jgi:hypothetical protein